MITVYIRDELGFFTHSEEVDHLGPMPRGTTLVAPPPLQGEEVARWNGESWDVTGSRPPESIEPQRALAIAQTYTDVDAVYDDAIGRRGTEYLEAETEARVFRAAGYTGTVSPYISGHAKNNPTGQQQTDKWAADEIIMRADAFLGAQLAMRNKRFESQVKMRAATTEADLNTAWQEWSGFIAYLRGQLGL